MRRQLRWFVLVLGSAAFIAAALPAAAVPAAAAKPGAPGLGDRLNPLLGNGGYDVLHYDLHLR